MDTLRVVVLGKVGSGKSSLANTIFGVRIFSVHHTASSHSKDLWTTFTREVNGRNIQLTDTPGSFDTDPRGTEFSPHRCIEESDPGPHAFLLVLKVDRFTCQEEAVRDDILECFSEDVLQYTTVVFTHGDDLPEGMRVEEWVNKNEALKILVRECGGRVHVFDNKYWNNSQDPSRNNQYQVRELIQTIDQTVREKGGGHYAKEMLQQVQQQVNNPQPRSIFSWLTDLF